jgi:hypothetical protein
MRDSGVGRHARLRASIVLAVTAAVILLAGEARAFETDQWFAWATPLADSAPVINAKFNLEIRRALADVSREGNPWATCEDVALAVRRRLKGQLFQPIELWAIQSPLVDQAPPPGTPAHRLLEKSIYRRAGPFDVGMWMPLSPTIEVDGVRIGTDKLAHFVSSGWKYRDAYLRRLRRGQSPAEAEVAAVRWGVLEERSINGTLASGIFSGADLEANLAGMRFYLSLCGGPDPLLERAGREWRIRRRFDIRTYVTPEWDESYRLPIFTRSRWRKVEPEIQRHCAEVSEQIVWQRLLAYRRRDRVTDTERIVGDLVREGDLPHPEGTPLESVCHEAAALPRPPPASHFARPPEDPAMEERLSARLRALEKDSSRRAFGLWGVRFSYPMRAGASAGVILPTLPRSDDCHSVCDVRGPLLRLTAGEAGSQLTLGWGRAVAETGESSWLLSSTYLGYSLEVGVLRTRGNSPLTPSRQTRVGVEGTFTITRVRFSLGAFASAGSGHVRRRWLLTGGLGLGF